MTGTEQSNHEPVYVWTHIVPPTVEDGEPEWAAWVTADDANWGTLHIIHIPNRRIVLLESVSLALATSAFWTGITLENQWEQLVNEWVAARDADTANSDD